jgi:elongation factor 1-gamma
LATHEILQQYISSIANKAKLLGSSKEESAQVLQWMVYINSELFPSLCEQYVISRFMPTHAQSVDRVRPPPPSPALHRFLFLPPASRPYNKANVAAAEKKANAMLDALENLLLTRTFLVGERITLADIFLANHLIRPFSTCLDASWRACHPNVLRHFNTIVHQPNFMAVLGGEPTLIEAKVAFTPPKKEKAAPAAAAPKSEKKKEKKDDDEDEEPLVPAEPKAKHPCEALGLAKCFPFDEWKRQYSNAQFPVAMKWLEEHIDLSEYSFWRVTYKVSQTGPFSDLHPVFTFGSFGKPLSRSTTTN